MAISCPSDRNVDGMVHRTTGYGEAFYEVLTAGRTAYQLEDFDRICHGGDMLKEVEANAARAKPARRRDAVRSNVGGAILAAISMLSTTGYQARSHCF